jgi:hypothetical protein
VGKIREAAAKQAKKVSNTLVMPDGRQVRFTPEARKQIPEETLAEIRWVGGVGRRVHRGEGGGSKGRWVEVHTRGAQADCRGDIG